MRLYLFVQLATGRFAPPHRFQAAASDLFAAWDADSGCRFTPVKWMPIQQQGSQRAQPQRNGSMASLRASFVTNPALRDIPAAAAVPVESREDRLARRHWEQVADLQRYGRTEFHDEGTPFVGDAFGF